ncbi:MAG TPA: hypothetical protein VFV22_03185 [Candidatus Paceibacterota bacterium]|nr:hypothetical protein [Candidatus Paceibacterota bacterium]
MCIDSSGAFEIIENNIAYNQTSCNDFVEDGVGADSAASGDGNLIIDADICYQCPPKIGL